jgi:hypothetical protein
MKSGVKPFVIEIKHSRRLVKIRMKQRLQEQSLGKPTTIADNPGEKNSDAKGEVSAPSRQRMTVSPYGD